MLEYGFKTEPEFNDNRLDNRYRAVCTDLPVSSEYGQMPFIFSDLSMNIREYFMTLMQENKAIPMRFSTDERDGMSIYMPTGTSWRIMFWNLFHEKGMTFEDIAELRPIKGSALRDGRTVLQQVKDIFNLHANAKYRQLQPYAQALGVIMTVGLYDIESRELITF